MNLCLFFEGTGQGVAGKITNVTRIRDLCVDDARQKLHLEPGLGTHFGSYLAGKIAGVDWRTTFRSARRWFETNYETLPKDGDVGGLYDDNHLVADLALAWIAAGAKREGLRFKRGARLSQKLDISAIALHDPHDEVSNLWGAFGRVRRNLSRLRLHFSCKGL